MSDMFPFDFRISAFVKPQKDDREVELYPLFDGRDQHHARPEWNVIVAHGHVRDEPRTLYYCVRSALHVIVLSTRVGLVRRIIMPPFLINICALSVYLS